MKLLGVEVENDKGQSLKPSRNSLSENPQIVPFSLPFTTTSREATECDLFSLP